MPSLLTDDWWPARREDVLEYIFDLLARQAVSSRQQRQLEQIVATSTCATSTGRVHVAVHIPFLVYAAVGGEDTDAALPVAASPKEEAKGFGTSLGSGHEAPRRIRSRTGELPKGTARSVPFNRIVAEGCVEVSG